MRYFIVTVATLVTGCGGATEPPVDAGGPVEAATDGGHGEPFDAAPDVVDSGLCCTDRSHNFLQCEAPLSAWVCSADPTSKETCTSPKCIAGSSCQGLSGIGIVVACVM